MNFDPYLFYSYLSFEPIRLLQSMEVAGRIMADAPDRFVGIENKNDLVLNVSPLQLRRKFFIPHMRMFYVS